MSFFDGSKADAESSKNTQNQVALLGSMRNLPPPSNDAASSGSPLKVVVKETGEIVYFSEKENGSLEIVRENQLETRLERWILQSAVKKLLPDKRVAKCCRIRAFKQLTIKVLYNAINKTAHFGGLQTCGSVWDDPVCAAKISERRRIDEVAPAMQAWESQGGQCLLLTLT